MEKQHKETNTTTVISEAEQVLLDTCEKQFCKCLVYSEYRRGQDMKTTYDKGDISEFREITYTRYAILNLLFDKLIETENMELTQIITYDGNAFAWLEEPTNTSDITVLEFRRRLLQAITIELSAPLDCSFLWLMLTSDIALRILAWYNSSYVSYMRKLLAKENKKVLKWWFKRIKMKCPGTMPQHNLYGLTHHNYCNVKRLIREIGDEKRENSHGFSDEENTAILTYIIQALAIELQGSLLYDFIANEEKSVFNPACVFLLNYFDGSHAVDALSDENTRYTTLDFSKDVVLCQPRCTRNMGKTLVSIKKNGFINDKGNHRGYFFDGMDFAIVWNGYHSSSAGIVAKKGTMEASVWDIKQYFNHITIIDEERSKSDTAADDFDTYWQNIHTGKRLDRIPDPRIALMYLAAQKRHELEQT